MADVVMWDGAIRSASTPTLKRSSSTARSSSTRDNPKLSPRSDFELGQEDNGHTGGAGQ
ncbi:MAG: hypothetical protein WDM89_04440 [Rhizomicrobium sp.]